MKQEIGFLDSSCSRVLGSTLWPCVGGALNTSQTRAGAMYIQLYHTLAAPTAEIKGKKRHRTWTLITVLPGRTGCDICHLLHNLDYSPIFHFLLLKPLLSGGQPITCHIAYPMTRVQPVNLQSMAKSWVTISDPSRGQRYSRNP